LKSSSGQPQESLAPIDRLKLTRPVAKVSECYTVGSSD
jgi:hypothetical protein